MKELFTIGEVAKLFDVNIRTLRYYDGIGLLKPERTDPETGYRYYSTRQFERLNTIKYLRALNMPIEKIADFFGNKDIDQMVTILRGQQEEIAARKRELELVEKKLQRRLTQIQDAVETVYDRIIEKQIPLRKAAYLRKEIPVGGDLEYPIRELERHNNLNAVMFLGKVGVSVSKKDLLMRRFEKFSGIFVLLEQEDDYRGDTIFLKESEYVTIRYQGTHEEAKGYYLELLSYMEQRGYEPDGDSVEITLIDAGMTNDSSRYVTELQIPFKIL